LGVSSDDGNRKNVQSYIHDDYCTDYSRSDVFGFDDIDVAYTVSLSSGARLLPPNNSCEVKILQLPYTL